MRLAYAASGVMQVPPSAAEECPLRERRGARLGVGEHVGERDVSRRPPRAPPRRGSPARPPAASPRDRAPWRSRRGGRGAAGRPRPRTSASYSPSRSFRSRVSTFPRIGVTVRSGRSARSWTRRRRLDVPTRAARGRDPTRVGVAATSTSRGSSRRGKAASTSPLGRSAGRSFRLCTARSTRPSRRASSISCTKRPLPPTSARWAVARRSPEVRIGTTSTARRGHARRRPAATSSACRSAS